MPINSSDPFGVYAIASDLKDGHELTVICLRCQRVVHRFGGWKVAADIVIDDLTTTMTVHRCLPRLEDSVSYVKNMLEEGVLSSRARLHLERLVAASEEHLESD